MRTLMILILVTTISCETVINPDLPAQTEQVVIYSFFRPGTSMRVDAFGNVGILEAEGFHALDGLNIEIYENGQVRETLTRNNGSYESTFNIEEGSQYAISLNWNGSIIRANTQIPSAVGLTNASITREEVDIDVGEYGYPASITFEDPVGSNYYLVELLVEDCGGGCDPRLFTGMINELLIEDLEVETSGNVDVSIGSGPETIDGFPYFYFNDVGFEGETYTFNFFVIPTLVNFAEDQDLVLKFVLKSLTQAYYDYLVTSDFQVELEDQNNFSEPVQIKGNVENGLGVFAGYNYHIYSIRI